MRRTNEIDYGKDAQITRELEKALKAKMEELFSENSSKDHFDYIKLLTSIEYKQTFDKQRKDVKEGFENENEEAVEKFINYIQNDYIKLYKDLVSKYCPEKPENSEKPLKKENVKPSQGKSILDRIKPKNEDQAGEIQKTQEKEKFVKKKKDPSKIRCKYWPSCKDESCLYAHPKEQCKHFPHCHYGDRCINIHPSIPCKFGLNCKRPNCAYKHPDFMNVI